MAVYVFEPELLTHAEVCGFAYCVVRSCNRVCSQHSTYCISQMLNLGVSKPRVIVADSIFFYNASIQCNGKFLTSHAHFLRKSACVRACVRACVLACLLTYVSAVFVHTDFVLLRCPFRDTLVSTCHSLYTVLGTPL